MQFHLGMDYNLSTKEVTKMSEQNEQTVTAGESILNSIKKQLDIAVDDDSFDENIIMHINSIFANLYQMGIGPSDVYQITDASNVWSEFIPNNKQYLVLVKSYMYLAVKVLFDPPRTSSLLEATNAKIREYEVRLYTEEGGY